MTKTNKAIEEYQELYNYINEVFDPNKHDFPLTKFKALETAIQKEITKGKIDELETIRKRNIDYRVALYVDERIAELEGELNKNN